MIFATSISRFLTGCACAIALSACGGGGSSTSSTPSPTPTSPPDNSAGAWLTLTPSSVDLSTYEGEDKDFVVSGLANKTFDKQIYIGVVETGGMIAPEVRGAGSGNAYSLQLRTAAALTAGVHTGQMEVRICEDDPVTCARPLPGSPWLVPLRINVKTKAEGAKRVVWSPNPIQIMAFEGEAATFDVVGQTTALPGNLSFSIGGGADFLGGVVSKSSNGLNFHYATLKTVAGLAPGVHDSTLELSLCRDAGPQCSQPVSGSPWTVPVRITVLPATNRTPLTLLPQVEAWSTDFGNAAHTSFVPATFDPAKFTRRWSKALAVNGVAIDGGLIFTTRYNLATQSRGIEAWSEETGELVWRRETPAFTSSDPVTPAAAAGKVYVRTDDQGNGALTVLDQATGALIKSVPADAPFLADMTPTVSGDDVYVGNGGGIAKFAAPQYQHVWNTATKFVRAGPAVDGQVVAAFVAGTMQVLTKSDGVPLFQVTEIAGVDQQATVTLSGKNMAFVTAQNWHFYAYDLTRKTRAWEIDSAKGGDSSFSDQPAYANDVLYFGGDVLRARSAQDGHVLWSSGSLLVPEDGNFFSTPLVTNNLAFLSSATRTIAVDLATRKVVWTYPLGGVLAISNRGILYIRGRTSMAAVNLQ